MTREIRERELKTAINFKEKSHTKVEGPPDHSFSESQLSSGEMRTFYKLPDGHIGFT